MTANQIIVPDMTAVAAGQPVLSVADLSVVLFTETSTVRAVRGVSYAVHAGETLAIVGESGSGKTVLNLAPLGLLPAGVTAQVTGSVLLGKQELAAASESDLAKVLGRNIGVVFQDPLSALNPNRRIGGQIEEVLTLRLGLTKDQARARAVALLQLVGIPEAAQRLRLFPHEMSGGMRQRVVIAIALAGEPAILIADEPTTALDVTIQAQIIDLLGGLQKRLGMAMVLVTHDIGVVANVADTVAVMYGGAIVEIGPAVEVLRNPQHPYTRALLASVPRPDAAVGSLFTGLSGAPPDLSKPITGCAFAPRCTLVQDRCRLQSPGLSAGSTTGGHRAACFVTTASQPARPEDADAAAADH
jgi:peptide/nickel transport system ATP-binding protein